MTSDFTRWTKTPRQAWAVTAVAFPICNCLMLLVGGLFTAISGELDFYFGLGALALGIPIMVIQWASNGSTCDGCLYNAVQGFKNVSYHITKGKVNFSWKKISLIVMFAGALVAASNILSSIVPWLLLLGTIVSLVGGVLIGHFWIITRKQNQEQILAAAEKKVQRTCNYRPWGRNNNCNTNSNTCSRYSVSYWRVNRRCCSLSISI